MPNSALVTYLIRAWSLSVTCNGNGEPTRRMLDLKLTHSGDQWDLIPRGHKPLGQLPTSLDLHSGDPVTKGGKMKGCGYLSYFQAKDSVPANVAGWAALPVSDFDRLWTLLSFPSELATMVTLRVGPVPSDVPNSHKWHVDNRPNLLISNLSYSRKSADWSDEL